MTVWTIHLPAAASAEPATERMVAVKEGFSWPALVLAPLWLIGKRMWVVLAFWLLGAVLLALAGRALPEGAEGVPLILGALLFAAEANDLHRWTLARRGFTLAGLVEARRKREAEAGFLRKWVAAGATMSSEDARAVRAKPALRPPIGAAPPPHPAPPVVGLFPHPAGRA